MLPIRSVPLTVHLECGVISDVLENGILLCGIRNIRLFEWVDIQ